MNRPIARPAPSAATLTAREFAARQIARHGIVASVGQIWRHEATGELVVLVGRTYAAWGVAPVSSPESVRMLAVDDLFEEFTYVECDHERACCPTHRAHTSPHRGCLLR